MFERCNHLLLKSNDEQDERSQLLDDTGLLGPMTMGKILEAQLRCSFGYLMFISEDWPLEENLYIILTDHKLKLLEEIKLGQWYVPGKLSSLAITGDGLKFNIFGYEWHLFLNPLSRHFPFRDILYGVKRLNGNLWTPRYLRLERRLIK